MQLSHRCLNLLSLPRVTGTDVACVPCGQCSECLKRKGNELAVRLIRECMASKYCYLLTFTYDDEHLPILKTESYVNTDSGEILPPFSQKFVSNDVERSLFFDSAPFTWHTNKYGVRVKRYHPLSFHDWNDVYTTFYMSLNYDEFKGYLKRMRHKVDKPFKYIAVPEYGGVGYRPHYHMILTGLPFSDVEKFVDDWTSGSVDVREVGSSSLDKTADFGKISSYVSKYASKGKFDCPYIFEGYCTKPRRSSSIGFGFGTDEMKDNLESYLCAFDVYGKFDVSDPPEGISIDLLKQRRKYALNNFSYPMPKYFIHHFFYQKGYDSLLKKYFSKATPLQKQVGASLLADVVHYFETESRKDSSTIEMVRSSLFSSYSAFHDSEKATREYYDSEFRKKILIDSIF